MKFRVTRTSDWYGEKAPCAGAFLTNPQRGPKEEAVWEIDMDTIEDVLALCKAEGEPLIIDCRYDDEPQSIEIYDSYRE